MDYLLKIVNIMGGRGFIYSFNKLKNLHFDIKQDFHRCFEIYRKSGYDTIWSWQ